MLWDHCYYSLDYNEDIRNLADPERLADLGRVVQFPYTVVEHHETPEDVVLKAQERKREQGRRLQVQANAVRQEKVRCGCTPNGILTDFMRVDDTKARRPRCIPRDQRKQND